MKQIAILSLCVVGSLAHANAVVLNPGDTLTTGSSPNYYSLFAAHHNPANAFFMVNEKEQFRFAYSPTFGFGTELGDVSNFADEIDELIDILDDPSLTDDGVEETLDHFNDVLKEVGEEGYIKINTGLSMPLFPMVWKPNFFSGAIVAEFDINTQISATILDDELTFDDQNQSFSTASSAYIKSGIQKRFALGYAQELFNKNKFERWGGQLYGGVKVNLISLELSKQVMVLENLDGKDIQDTMEDEYDNNLEATANVGLDAGLLWVTPKYRAGFTITNINSPEFDYGSIGVNCSQYAESSVQRNNCDAAYYFGAQLGDIQLKEKHTKHPTATIDGTYYFSSRFMVTSSLELAAYDDLVGTENQWLHVATTYLPDSYLIPGIRAGYHKNLAGSKISSLSLGTTLFGVFTFDLEVALDNIKVDGSSAPRTTGFALGFQEKF